MIKAILFDFYGVICSDDLWDFVGINKQGRSEIHELADEVNLGKINWDEFCRSLSIASGRRVEEVNSMYQAFRINRPLMGLIGQLKNEYKIGLLTNANRGHIAGILDDIGAADEFDSLVVSADIGMIKPQPGIYREAAKQLGVETEECLFVDDAIINVDGAEAVGMKSILYSDFQSFAGKITGILEASQ